MSKMIKAKKIVATLVVCCGLIGARTAEAFVWPCIDITQISSFISSITTGISTITNAVSQVKNIQQTVQAVGNQVSGLRDFMADLRQTIVSVKESINMVTKSIKEVIDEVDETLKMAEDITQNFGDQEKEKSKGTENEIVTAISFSGFSSLTDEEVVDVILQIEKLFNEKLIFEDSRYNRLGFKYRLSNELNMNNGEKRYYKITGKNYIERV